MVIIRVNKGKKICNKFYHTTWDLYSVFGTFVLVTKAFLHIFLNVFNSP